MIGLLIRPEWWNWAMFVIIPLFLVALVAAVGAIFSGILDLIRRYRAADEQQEQAQPHATSVLKGWRGDHRG